MPREGRAPRPLRRISVVIPARDEARTIGRTLAAVFAQEVPGVELEVLVVDDGSRDDTAAVASGAGARVLRPSPGERGDRPARRATGVPRPPRAIRWCSWTPTAPPPRDN